MRIFTSYTTSNNGTNSQIKYLDNRDYFEYADKPYVVSKITSIRGDVEAINLLTFMTEQFDYQQLVYIPNDVNITISNK